MDTEKILGSLITKRSSENVGQKFTTKLSVKNINDSDTRKEHKQVNQSILKNIMHEWTTVVEDPTVVNNTETVKIDVSKPGVERNAWKIHKEYLLKDDSMAGEMMRILRAGNENLSKPNPEDGYKESIARLQQERSDRMHHEQMMSRRRMNNKIKSKGFHRHAKRKDLKEFLKNEENKTDNDENLKNKLLEFEKIRAQERISLKHKVGGKFAKIQKLRAKYDPNAREALTGMREKGKELTVKMNDDDDSDESREEEEEGESEISDENEEEDSEEESQDEEMVAAGRSGEMENSKSHKAKIFVEKNMKNGESEENPKVKEQKVSSTISTNQSNFLNFQDGIDLDMEESGEVVGSTDEARFKDAIYEIYQHDSELAAEFEKQKSELVEMENPKDLQMFHPGWGTWTGEGFEAADERRKKRGLIKAPDVNRKDKKKTRVWIKQGVHDGLKKHLIKSIPFPYNTAEQFNLSRKELISSTFNFQTVHRELVKPKFVNKAGQHIYPRQKLEKKIN